MGKQKPFYIVVGPSGSGKTTLTRRSGLREVVSHTTRARRDGEVDGVDYFFVSKAIFDAIPMVETTEFDGNFYGASKAECDAADVIVAEPYGAKQLKDYCEAIGRPCLIIGLVCHDPAVYEERMRRRGDSETKIQKRLANDALAFAELGEIADIFLYSDQEGYEAEFMAICTQGRAPAAE